MNVRILRNSKRVNLSNNKKVGKMKMFKVIIVR